MAKSTNNRFSPFVKQCFVTAGVCSNIIGHGCVVGFPAVLLPQLHRPGALVPITKEGDSWITSSMAISLLVGNFITPSVMDRLGRRAAHLVVATPALLGWFIMVLATSFEAIMVARVLHGLSFGLSLPLRSVLIGEYTSPKNRGAFLTTVSLAQAIGIFLVHILGSVLDWQKTAILCTFFPFVCVVLTLYSPESPTYLAVQGKYEECRKVFRWLRGDGEEEELDEMIKARIEDNDLVTENNLKEMLGTLKKKEFYKPIIIMIHANAMMQFAGGTTMSNYATVILGLIIGVGADVNFWMIALDGQRIISNIIAVYVINKCKRRTMMFSVGSLCVLSHLAIAGYVYAREHGMLFYDAKWIPILLVNIQFFTVATGMVPIPNVIAGEVFPTQYRSIGGSISIVSVSVFTFLALKTFPGLTDSVGIHGTYFIYAVVLTYFLLVIWVYLPETKGRTLQQIEDEMRGRLLTPQEAEEKTYLQRKMSRKISVISAQSVAIEL